MNEQHKTSNITKGAGRDITTTWLGLGNHCGLVKITHFLCAATKRHCHLLRGQSLCSRGSSIWRLEHASTVMCDGSGCSYIFVVSLCKFLLQNNDVYKCNSQENGLNENKKERQRERERGEKKK